MTTNAPEYSVSEIASALKRTVEDAFARVRVRGEISGLKRAASGHLYLCLKDDRAVLDGVLWRTQAASLRFRPEDGLEVVATGRLTTYPGRSKYQLVIDSLEPAGVGALMALLEARKAQLAAEGLFAAERKRSLPFLPEVIGVVTSPTGAVIRDILHRLEDRFPRRVIVWPVLVQGEGAAAQVAAAVRGFNALDGLGPTPRPDLLIVARGGGSIEDLWAFNEEIVVRAVAESSIPVISAVGHETDTTLVDFAADRRAPTPTAAAEMAVPVAADLRIALADLALRRDRSIARLFRLGRERTRAISARLPAMRTLLTNPRQTADELGERLPRALRSVLERCRLRSSHAGAALRPQLLERRTGDARQRLAHAERCLVSCARARVGDARGALASRGPRLRPYLLRTIGRRAAKDLQEASRLLEGLGPIATMRRGYAVVERAAGGVVTRASGVESEERLRLRFADGELGVTVNGGASHAHESPASDDAAGGGSERRAVASETAAAADNPRRRRKDEVERPVETDRAVQGVLF
jgi:exodeoxyribonuclease VII large subunit